MKLQQIGAVSATQEEIHSIPQRVANYEVAANRSSQCHSRWQEETHSIQ